jgi:hypothetical protein
MSSRSSYVPKLILFDETVDFSVDFSSKWRLNSEWRFEL